MKRRTFIALSATGAAMLGLTGAAALWSRGADGRVLTVAAALQKIDELAQITVISSGKWDAHQIFAHCAQTIEFSMAGYPAPKSRLFQNTAGAAAFALFSSSRKMTHRLSEPVDGAAPIAASPEFGKGLARLRQAFVGFRDFDGALAPHFAYGPLSKQDYEMAHVMHFWNHLDEISSLPDKKV
jgi:hypothetical protein